MPDTIETLIKTQSPRGVRRARRQEKTGGDRPTLGPKIAYSIRSWRQRDHGRDELDSAVAALHQRLPSYVFQRASACRSASRKRALGLELWTTGPRTYQGRRCGSCARWSHLSHADVSLMRCRRSSNWPSEVWRCRYRRRRRQDVGFRGKADEKAVIPRA